MRNTPFHIRNLNGDHVLVINIYSIANVSLSFGRHIYVHHRVSIPALLNRAMVALVDEPT